MNKFALYLVLIFSFSSCGNKKGIDQAQDASTTSQFDWDAATIYFLLTDRFLNGDTSNDKVVHRENDHAIMRGFEGGDFAGIIQKLEENYFTDLGVDALWLTPIFEQVKGGVDEGTGITYAYHGYWTRDWTAVEPTLGTIDEFKKLVQVAHDKNIRVLLDVVINHTGPVTQQDGLWPDDWVRTGPVCTYSDQNTAVSCTLTDNLPDIRTDSKEEVELPKILVDKWMEEGRHEQEVQELNNFFERSNLPRTPANYLIKWVTDYARETGVDGFRIDTVKHVEEEVWSTFIEQSRLAYETWKIQNPDKVIHNDEFFILGELYGYNAYGGRKYQFSDRAVDYYNAGYDAMINFGFKYDASEDYDKLFTKYDSIRNNLINENPDDQVNFVNYISSHDDGQPLDPLRERSLEAGTKLLLTPGIAQIYYGDETSRILKVDQAVGDANLRSKMNWDSIDQESLDHWSKLGTFRRDHPAVAAGKIYPLPTSSSGSLTLREYNKNGLLDRVIIGAGLTNGKMVINVSNIFGEGQELYNYYDDKIVVVRKGSIEVMVNNGVILMEEL